LTGLINTSLWTFSVAMCLAPLSMMRQAR